MMEFWESFWDIIWWFLWVFVFVAYLMVLFQIITDLFRDRDLNGWAKAAWLILMLFLPIVTALIYLIARGRGMAERSAHWAEASRKQTESYIREVAGATPSDEIAKAKALLESGAITQTEYDTLKARAISGEPHPVSAEHGPRADGSRESQPALP
jgi:uncharacterized membrane protein YcjF (UPF0283 family)